MVKNVVVLGSAYGGGRSARLLAQGLPKTHRVVIVERNSHFNHLYLFPRYGVLPGHAHKGFIPDSDFFSSPLFSASASDNSNPNAPVIVHASAVKLGDGFIELDQDVTEHNAKVCLADSEEGRVGGASRAGDHLRTGLTLHERHPRDPAARRRIPWDYLVYATGCEMPRALAMDGRTKDKGVRYLQIQSDTIARAKNILVAGGGALGIQYATDIADLYNNPEHAAIRPPGVTPKKITLVHSRSRFMPIYKPELHDLIMKRMEVLGINVILEDRLEVPSEEILHKMEDNVRKRHTHTVRTRKGKAISTDLVLVCTGQRPNSHLLQAFAPAAVNEWGYVRIGPTLQAHGLPRVFGVGDVADAGVIKAGHTAWNMGTIAAENIIALTKGADEKELQTYEKTPPMIKVTLGLVHGAAEMRLSKEPEIVVAESSDGVMDGHWEVIWRSRGADPSDPMR